MLHWLNSNISVLSLIWLFPITFLLHDFEEIIFIESWFKKNYKRLVHRIPNKLRNTFQELSTVTSAQFSIPVFFQFIMYIVASYLAAEQHIYGLFIGFNVLLFIHVFTHIGQSLAFGTYALGTGTAMFITFPYSIYLFYRLLNEEIITFNDVLLNAPYGILTVLVVFFGHKISPKILPSQIKH
ncbi:hypothetical protein J2S09_003649 [Bacillus fengqiuensis]|nr:hypothetical protein [Bacillus fengqiuensis]